MNRKIFGLVSVFVLSAMLVLNSGYVQAQTPGQIPVFDQPLTGFCNSVEGNDCIDSVITQDASGNVGIGTTNPTAKLDVAGNVAIGTGVNSNGGGFKHLRVSAPYGAGQTVTYAFTWPTPFADSNYTVIATVQQTGESSGPDPRGCKVVHVLGYSRFEVRLKVTNDDDLTARTCIIHLVGIHD